ncbi:hypothetical protein ACCS93_38785 [Rhizobium ruizarguesonis]
MEHGGHSGSVAFSILMTFQATFRNPVKGHLAVAFSRYTEVQRVLSSASKHATQTQFDIVTASDGWFGQRRFLRRSAVLGDDLERRDENVAGAFDAPQTSVRSGSSL